MRGLILSAIAACVMMTLAACGSSASLDHVTFHPVIATSDSGLCLSVAYADTVHHLTGVVGPWCVSVDELEHAIEQAKVQILKK